MKGSFCFTVLHLCRLKQIIVKLEGCGHRHVPWRLSISRWSNSSWGPSDWWYITYGPSKNNRLQTKSQVDCRLISSSLGELLASSISLPFDFGIRTIVLGCSCFFLQFWYWWSFWFRKFWSPFRRWVFTVDGVLFSKLSVDILERWFNLTICLKGKINWIVQSTIEIQLGVNIRWSFSEAIVSFNAVFVHIR